MEGLEQKNKVGCSVRYECMPEKKTNWYVWLNQKEAKCSVRRGCMRDKKKYYGVVEAGTRHAAHCVSG